MLSRIETPTVTTESTAEYAKMSKAERDAIKDRGGFVAGHLRDNRRLVDHVVCRSMLVYDMDFITYEYLKTDVLSGMQCVVHNPQPHAGTSESKTDYSAVKRCYAG